MTEKEIASPDAVYTRTPSSFAHFQKGGPDRSDFYGWPGRNDAEPRVLLDDEGRVTRIRTPVLDLEGLLTPKHLHYLVQHFQVPDAKTAEQWQVTIDGEVKAPLTLSYEALRKLPARTVRVTMECSGSDVDFFDYMKGERTRPSRAEEGMVVSAAEFTGVPLAAVLARAGIGPKAAHIRVEGWDRGVPPTAAPGTEPFFYDKGLPLEKALHPDTILAWAHNGELLEHLYGAPIRLVVPGWSGNWSVKWVQRIELTRDAPDCWYHWQFYYYGNSPDDPHKELVTTMPVRSIVTSPRDDLERIPAGEHVLRGRAWSGTGAIALVEVSVDGGATWRPAHIEPPQERWLWVRWSLPWEATPGRYRIMSRATDEVGNVEPAEPRWNYMKKNFSAVVPMDVEVV